ncbi:MAG: hypothetical protein Q6353_001655 [Candidatus Sigynarchaeum springense]
MRLTCIANPRNKYTLPSRPIVWPAFPAWRRSTGIARDIMKSKS